MLVFDLHDRPGARGDQTLPHRSGQAPHLIGAARLLFVVLLSRSSQIRMRARTIGLAGIGNSPDCAASIIGYQERAILGHRECGGRPQTSARCSPDTQNPVMKFS